jgi:hypothetical protein
MVIPGFLLTVNFQTDIDSSPRKGILIHSLHGSHVDAFFAPNQQIFTKTAWDRHTSRSCAKGSGLGSRRADGSMANWNVRTGADFSKPCSMQ